MRIIGRRKATGGRGVDGITHPTKVVEVFRADYGPTNRAFAALDVAGQRALRHDLEQLWPGNTRARDGSTHVEAEYLEVRAIRA